MQKNEVQDRINYIHGQLCSLRNELDELAETLKNPLYETGTDRPLNAAAKIQGLLKATLGDEIEPALRSLRRASRVRGEAMLSDRHVYS